MCRYHAVLFPVTGFVCEMLPEGSRDSGRAELFFEDLEKLVPEDVARICEWLTEKVDGFSAKLKPEAKEIQEVCFPVLRLLHFAQVRCLPQSCLSVGLHHGMSGGSSMWCSDVGTCGMLTWIHWLHAGRGERHRRCRPVHSVRG